MHSSTLGHSSAAVIWSAFRHTSRHLVRRAPVAKTGIASLMSIVAALCIPQRADANTVTVTITGTMTSGIDTTGVFGGGQDRKLANAIFNLTYVIDDRYGTSCAIYSCISGGISRGMNTSPMTEITLMIIGNDFKGKFTFGDNPFSRTLLSEEASRQLNFNGHAALLKFHETEQAYTLPYSGNSNLTTDLYVDAVKTYPSTLNMDPCWEDNLYYVPAANDTGDLYTNNNGFQIYVYKDNERNQVAEGDFNILAVTIYPCCNNFAGHQASV